MGAQSVISREVVDAAEAFARHPGIRLTRPRGPAQGAGATGIGSGPLRRDCNRAASREHRVPGLPDGRSHHYLPGGTAVIATVIAIAGTLAGALLSGLLSDRQTRAALWRYSQTAKQLRLSQRLTSTSLRTRRGPLRVRAAFAG
nr:hypothetical protein StreXyl84_63890 [Streptomyces sp. Xyl84]